VSEELFQAGGLYVTQYAGPARADHGDRRRYQFTTEDEQLTIGRETWEALADWFNRHPRAQAPDGRRA
jgi:hypothetical protein